jgi:hypothetical protein
LRSDPIEFHSKVAVQFFAQSFLTQEWAAVFGRENSVNQNFGEGLGHGLKMQEPAA